MENKKIIEVIHGDERFIVGAFFSFDKKVEEMKIIPILEGDIVIVYFDDGSRYTIPAQSCIIKYEKFPKVVKKIFKEIEAEEIKAGDLFILEFDS
jgi:hypothetical protein